MLNVSCANDISEIDRNDITYKCFVRGYVVGCPETCEAFRDIRKGDAENETGNCKRNEYEESIGY